jgi:peptidoglycan/LPS O-acetylase OafA/YrhL
MYDARLDGLRTLAILPVLFFHASLRAGLIVDTEQAVST